MTTENKKILSYFGIAVGLGLVGAMIYFGLSDKAINIDKTSVVLGDDEEDETTTETSSKDYSQVFANMPKFDDKIEFQFKSLKL